MRSMARERNALTGAEPADGADLEPAYNDIEQSLFAGQINITPDQGNGNQWNHIGGKKGDGKDSSYRCVFDGVDSQGQKQTQPYDTGHYHNRKAESDLQRFPKNRIVGKQFLKVGKTGKLKDTRLFDKKAPVEHLQDGKPDHPEHEKKGKEENDTAGRMFG